MKEILKKMIVDTINSWSEDDIYAVSLFVYDDEDDPTRPTVTLGFNTESWFDNVDPDYDDPEKRWNYAFWIQNQEMEFGYDDTAELVRQWVEDQGFSVDENEEDDDEAITEAFVAVLIDIVKEIHDEKILTAKFGKELPILIHELEYYDQIAKQNIEANGEELVKEFSDWIFGMYLY